MESPRKRVLRVLEKLGFPGACYDWITGHRVTVMFIENGSPKWYRGTIMESTNGMTRFEFDDGETHHFYVDEMEAMERNGEMKMAK